MIDFHSHILPGIDDGSPDVATSLEMLRRLKSQGVDTVAATSHYYIDRCSVQQFLQKRQKALNALGRELPDDAPRIVPGAEVLYFPGISRFQELPLLLLEGTDVLLLEMPFNRWNEHMIGEVLELAHGGACTVMLAHIERYLGKCRRSAWYDLLDNGVLMQANADFFLRRWTKRKALSLLREGRIHLLGTDCHNLDSRPPRMEEAAAAIRNELGSGALFEMEELGRSILGETEI